MSNDATGVPDWEVEQLEIIMEDSASWQLVVAGPGTGKSAVACQRVAYLVDDGVPPSRILLVSFTRTAVAELRDRIISYAVAGEQAKSVRISTIDSHAWSLRVGFDDEPLLNVLGDGSYDLSIIRVTELFNERQPDLIEFMKRLEHVIIDEAQDVVGVRARLIVEMLHSLADRCGVTILADPAQAIYGFTTDENDAEEASVSLLELLQTAFPSKLTSRRLDQIHRIQRPELIEVFESTRKEVEEHREQLGHVSHVQQTIRDASGNDVGFKSWSDLAGLLATLRGNSTLVLFRRRAEVLIASSFCSNAGIEHRLRMAGTPVIVSPWIGWLFGDTIATTVSKAAFEELWCRRFELASAPFQGLGKDSCWAMLHRISAGRRIETLDMVQLRQILARSRPPVELCLPECGIIGPILGTIHASKGREADTVMLVIPATDCRDNDNPAAMFEEGRVYYVGATRARSMLIVVADTATPVSYLDSRRVFRKLTGNRVQVEIGREGDIDHLAHLGWMRATEIQLELAKTVGQTRLLLARNLPENNYSMRLEIAIDGSAGITRYVEIGELSQFFCQELGRIWTIIDSDKKLKPPPHIQHLYLVAVTTVGIPDDLLYSVRPPFNQSGLALAPVIKGFPTIPFLFRKYHR